MPGQTPFGSPDQDVNLAAALGQQVKAFPQVRLGEQLFRGGDVYDQDPGVAGALQRFIGAPREQDIQELTPEARAEQKKERARLKREEQQRRS
jgi:hypothetical protein